MEEKLYTQTELNKAALEARIDELERIVPSKGFREAHPSYVRRLSELKQQLQELEK